MTADLEELNAWIEKNKDLARPEPLNLKDYSDTECPVCKKAKIVHDNAIDIDANMIRIRRLMQLVNFKPPKPATPPPPLTLSPAGKAVNDAIADLALKGEKK